MLQKYFPILEEINSPFATMAALNLTVEATKIVISGISNEVLESLLWAEIEETSARKVEIEVAASELEKARVTAAKQVRSLRYRAAQAARSARKISKLSRQVKAVRRPLAKGSLKGLSGLTLEACRQKAVETQVAVRVAANNFSAANEVVTTAIEGGDVRTIRVAVAALKEAVRLLEVRHIEFKFAREMLSIALARHSA